MAPSSTENEHGAQWFDVRTEVANLAEQLFNVAANVVHVAAYLAQLMGEILYSGIDALAAGTAASITKTMCRDHALEALKKFVDRQTLLFGEVR